MNISSAYLAAPNPLASESRPWRHKVLTWAQRYTAWCQRREQDKTRPGHQAETLRRAHF